MIRDNFFNVEKRSFHLRKTTEDQMGIKSLIGFLNAQDDPDFAELRADVQNLLDPPPIPARARSDRSRREYWLRVIGKKVLAMKVSQGRAVMRLGDWPYLSKPHRLRLGNEVFIYAASPRITGNRR